MSKYIDSIIGHAIGDAMGVPIEFEPRIKLLEHPITKMIGYGSHDVPAGTWSDDTSMEIATIDSFINKGSFDCKDIMMNFYYWLKENRFTPTGVVFDAGHTCIQSIINFSKGYELDECGQKDLYSNGNGSLMRILPVALYSYSKSLKDSEIVKLTNDISSLTHAHEISKLGCYIYVRYVMFLLSGLDKFEAYNELKKINYDFYSNESIEAYKRILKEDLSILSVNDIKSSGYVVDTLEASIWVILQCKSFKEAIIGAINLGDDTDTVGAITGSMAGIIYGYNSIPEEWLDVLAKKDYLINLAMEFEKKSSTLEKDVILGTIIGDISGSRFELVNNKNGKKFELFHKNCRYTDDSVMTLAVAKALIDSKDDLSDIEDKTIKSMSELGRKYPDCGYGPSFYQWIISEEHKPYGSFGNGAAMRISPVGVAINSIDKIKSVSAIITNVSHNHPDSISGAEAIAVAIRMALNGENKGSIKQYIESNYFKIDDLKVDTMKPQYFHINCVETVKQSLSAFFDSYDFEDAIRNAIALGGDSDTIGAITGSIAAAYYGIPKELIEKALPYLDKYLIKIHDQFNEKYEVK